MILEILSIVVLAYFLGSVTGAYYLTKWMIGKDIRELGSGNAGAKNAGRHLGKKGFLITLLIDVGKVILALYITSVFFPENDWMLMCSALFLLIGHIWPIQLGFKGGKGVVVFLASALFAVPLSILILGLTMGICFFIIRSYTAAGFISMATIPITAWVLQESYFAMALFLLFIIVALQHTKKT